MYDDYVLREGDDQQVYPMAIDEPLDYEYEYEENFDMGYYYDSYDYYYLEDEYQYETEENYGFEEFEDTDYYYAQPSPSSYTFASYDYYDNQLDQDNYDYSWLNEESDVKISASGEVKKEKTWA